MIFNESDIQFDFASRYWAGRKYDEHTFFRGLSGAGLKGVDFVGIYRGRQLLLMEVKHFRYSREVPITSLLAAEIAAKIEDTLTGITAIHQYFQRSPLYRFAEPLLGRLPARQRLEWPFWTRAYQLGQDPQCREILVWLEVEKESFPEKEAFIQQLRSHLGGPWKVTVADRDDYPFTDSLRIR